ncbi:MAG: hypothetical protein WCL50_15305, partial [Spirochaetota bacterium]
MRQPIAKRPARPAFLLALILCLPFAAPAEGKDDTPPEAAKTEKPHLAVLGFANETGSKSTDAATNAATDTILLTLHQLGLYELLPVAGAVARDVESLRAWAESHKADYVMFGRIGRGADSGFVCGLALFDRAKGRISIDRQSGEVSALELFETSDQLIASVLDEVSGRHIGFGRLLLEARGEKGSYRVLLDGMEAGTDLPSIDAVLNGSHTVSVVQRRMFGELELAKKSFTVEEGTTVGLVGESGS